MVFRKGQGATEYLVLLAVVLIIALVSIALLGFFPGLSGDARITQSDSYWRGTARPFAITDHVQTGTSLTLVLLNTESQSETITNMTVGGVTPANLTATKFAGGQQMTLPVTFNEPNCAPGGTYEYNVTIQYTAADGLDKVQTGSKTLIGKC